MEILVSDFLDVLLGYGGSPFLPVFASEFQFCNTQHLGFSFPFLASLFHTRHLSQHPHLPIPFPQSLPLFRPHFALTLVLPSFQKRSFHFPTGEAAPSIPHSSTAPPGTSPGSAVEGGVAHE